MRRWPSRASVTSDNKLDTSTHHTHIAYIDSDTASIRLSVRTHAYISPSHRCTCHTSYDTYVASMHVNTTHPYVQRTHTRAIASHLIASHLISSHLASHRIPSHPIASMTSHHRIMTSHRIAPHRIASHRIAYHLIACHRISSPYMTHTRVHPLPMGRVDCRSHRWV